jgi:hypothetical protein
MTVLMTFKVDGDPDRLVELNRQNPQRLQDILNRGKDYGVLRHCFWSSGSTILVVDEWPDEESFQAFFAASPEIKDAMAAAGVRSEPEVTFWHKLDTGDEL